MLSILFLKIENRLKYEPIDRRFNQSILVTQGDRRFLVVKSRTKLLRNRSKAKHSNSREGQQKVILSQFQINASFRVPIYQGDIGQHICSVLRRSIPAR